MPTELEEVLHRTSVLSQHLTNMDRLHSSLSSFITATPKSGRRVRHPRTLSDFQQRRSHCSSCRESRSILQNPTSAIQDRPTHTSKRFEAVGQGLRGELYPFSPSLDEEQALSESMKPIAKDALTILINISNDSEVLGFLAEDDAFLESLLARITVCQFVPSLLFTAESLALPHFVEGILTKGISEFQRTQRRRHINAPSQPIQVPFHHPHYHTHSDYGACALPIKVGGHAAA